MATVECDPRAEELEQTESAPERILQTSLADLRAGVKAGVVPPTWETLSESVLPHLSATEERDQARGLTLGIWHKNPDTVQPTMENLQERLISGEQLTWETQYLFQVAHEKYGWKCGQPALEAAAAQLLEPEQEKLDYEFRFQLLNNHEGGIQAFRKQPVGEILDNIIAQREQDYGYGRKPFLRLDRHRQDKFTQGLARLVEDDPEALTHLLSRAEKSMEQAGQPEKLDYRGRLYFHLAQRLQKEGEHPLDRLMAPFARQELFKDQVLGDDRTMAHLFDGVRGREYRATMDRLKVDPKPELVDSLLELHYYKDFSGQNEEWWGDGAMKTLGSVEPEVAQERFAELEAEYKKAGSIDGMGARGRARLRFVEFVGQSDPDLDLKLRRLLANELLAPGKSNYALVRRIRMREIEGIIQSLEFEQRTLGERLAATEKCVAWIGDLPSWHKPEEKSSRTYEAFRKGVARSQSGRVGALVREFENPEKSFRSVGALMGDSEQVEAEADRFLHLLQTLGGESNFDEVLDTYQQLSGAKDWDAALKSHFKGIVGETESDSMGATVEIEFEEGPDFWIGSVLLERQE